MKKSIIILLTLLTSISTLAYDLDTKSALKIKVSSVQEHADGSVTFENPRIVISGEALIVGSDIVGYDQEMKFADEICAGLGYSRVVHVRTVVNAGDSTMQAEINYKDITTARRKEVTDFYHDNKYLKNITCKNLGMKTELIVE